jgi:ribosomal protein S2
MHFNLIRRLNNSLQQCFSSDVARNRGVRRSENKGSARKFLYSIKNNLNIINIDFTLSKIRFGVSVAYKYVSL